MSAVPAPTYCPTTVELDDLDVLLAGGFAPVTAYVEGGPARLRLPHDVAASVTDEGALEIVDPEGFALAVVEPAVVDDDGMVTGPVRLLGTPAYGPFRRLHLNTTQVREQYPDAVTLPVRRPLTADDLSAVNAARTGRGVVLLALTGAGMPESVSAVGLVRATLAAAELLGAHAHVVVCPLARSPDTDADRIARVAANYAPAEVIDVPHTGELPESVAGIVVHDRPPPGRRGVVVFLTGLSGSGKSTLARALHDLVLETGQRTVTTLDGDVVRRHLSAGLGFSRADRETNISRIGWVAAEIARHGGLAIASPIAPYDVTRKRVRAMVEEAGGTMLLVHVATPLEECERRDRKGLYARARRGEIPDFTGISSAYEEPDDADVRVDTTGRTVPDALADVLRVLYAEGHLTPAEPNDG